MEYSANIRNSEDKRMVRVLVISGNVIHKIIEDGWKQDCYHP